jgi:hypothetical protein
MARPEHRTRCPPGRPGQPRAATLSDVDPLGPQRQQPVDLLDLVDGSKVQVESILGRLRFRYPHEQESGQPLRRRPYLEHVEPFVDDDPPEGLLPPASK